jgi:transcriptional regulator with XRE-family HTH domain
VIFIPKTDIQRALGWAIQKHRGDVNLTQEKLAEKSNTHRTYLADIERGVRNPSVETIRRLSLGLKIPISVLFQTAEVRVKGSFKD